MPGKILIVDDEVHIRMLLEQTLEELEEDHGVTILSAQNGEEGLALIRSEKPDVVFLDIMMPKLNGYEVCQHVKEDSSITDIGIVLLTAKGQEVDRRQGLDLGATRYMTKPFDPDEVLRVARELFERGLWVPAIRPPTVPKGTARLRVSLSAAHSEAHLQRLVDALRELA